MMPKSRIVLICSFVCFVFFAGYLSFSVYAFRIGWRPQSWRFIGSDAALVRAINRCFSGNDFDRTQFMICAQKMLIFDVKRWGIQELMYALAYRLGEQTTDRNFTQCHDLAHAIGWAGTVVTRNLQTTLPLCTNTCVSGCQHGAVSAWYSIGHNIKDQLPTLCTTGIDWSKNPQGQGGCFHEVGHAVASFSSFDLEQSLHLCDSLIPQGRVDCAAGVFMEMYEAATFAQAPQPIPTNHPAWCAKLWAPYDRYCYDQAGSYEYSRSQDERKTFAVCRQIPKPYQKRCFGNIGQNIFYVYQHKTQYLEEVRSFCHRGGEDMFFACLSGLITSSVFVEPDITSSVRLCAELDSSEQHTCYAIIGGVLQSKRSEQEKQRLCASIPAEYQKTCISSTVDIYTSP